MNKLSDDETPIEAKLVAPAPGLEGDLDTTSDAPPAKPGMFQGRAAVLGILFLVTGAIGLPLLWVSPSFSRGERIFWTIAVLAYTGVLLAMAGGAIWWGYSRLFQ